MNRFLFFIGLIAFTGIAFAQTSVEFKITQPEELTVNAGDDLSVVLGDTVEIGSADAIQGGTPPYYYGWYPFNVMSNYHILITEIWPFEDDDFALSVTDSRNCLASDKLSVTVRASSAIQSHEAETGISIYPNPAKEYFKINTTQNLADVDVSILTLSGQVLTNYQLSGQALENKEFAVPSEKGIYLVNIQSGDISQSIQLIVSEK